MKKYIENLRQKSLLGYIFIQPIYYIFRLFIKTIPDRTFVELKFRWHMDYSLNLDNPKTLNEKINWLKLNDRTQLHTICADKYRVREYVSEKIGTDYLVPLYFQTDNPNELIPENISNIPCIIKANHDSSGGIFVYDKSKIDWVKVQEGFKKRLKQNYFWSSREWQYKNIKPTIVVEKLLQDNQGNIPFDYKLHCFNGKVRMISVDLGRDTDEHHRNWYSREWIREPYKWSSQKGSKFTDPTEEDVERPKTLEEMIRLSEILAQPFAYVRVDWYDVNGQLYFGEITFHHDGGVLPILPKIWDEKLGALLKLQKI